MLPANAKPSVPLRERVKNALNMDRERTPEESKARGKALRVQCPREDHAFWEPPVDRPDPVELLRKQGESRVKSLLPLRYERMSASAFTFYRGGALIMASDLSITPTTGINVQVCGDAHISNFGLFSSPSRSTVFDINDFDETLPGPWEWDVKRLAASVEICGRDNGFSKKQRRAATLACVRSYREAMRAFAKKGNLDVWYSHINMDNLRALMDGDTVSSDARVAIDKTLSKAKAKDSARAVRKMTEVVDGKLRIVSDQPVIVPIRDFVDHWASSSDSEKAALEGVRSSGMISRLAENFDEASLERLMGHVLREYRKSLDSDKQRLISQYTAVDMAHKVVGVGSVGTRAWIIVLKGASENDPLVLQVKEAQASVLEQFVGKSVYQDHGRRVVSGQRAIQAASDVLLGWCTLRNLMGERTHYYVRQLWDGKGSIDLSTLSPKALEMLAGACGWTLARAHARTGDRFAIAAYMGKSDTFDKAVASFAVTYADQNEADYARFMDALNSGQLA